MKVKFLVEVIGRQIQSGRGHLSSPLPSTGSHQAIFRRPCIKSRWGGLFIEQPQPTHFSFLFFGGGAGRQLVSPSQFPPPKNKKNNPVDALFYKQATPTGFETTLRNDGFGRRCQPMAYWRF